MATPLRNVLVAFFPLMLALLLVAFWHWCFGPKVLFTLDDAYITASNATQLVRGGPPDPYGSANPWLAATSVLHLWLLAAVVALGVAADTANLFLGLVMCGVYVCLCGALLKRLGIHVVAAGFLSVMLILLGPGLGLWLNGLETGLALCAVLAIIYFDLGPVQRREHPIAAFSLGLAASVRPEVAILSVLFFFKWQFEAQRQSPLRLVGQIIIALLPYCALKLPALLASGGLGEGTMAVKMAFYAESGASLNNKMRIATQHLWAYLTSMLPLSIFALTLLFNRLGRLLLIWCALVFLGNTWFFPVGLSHNFHRYLHVFDPVLLLGLLIVLSNLNARWGEKVGSVVALGLVFACAYPAIQSLSLYRNALASAGASYLAVAEWIKTVPKQGEVVAVHDAGAPAFGRTRATLVDLVGLKTPESYRVHREITWPSVGTERVAAIAAIAGKHRPDYLVVLADWDKSFGFTAGFRQAGFALEPLAPIGSAGWTYSVYRVTQLAVRPKVDSVHP